MPVVVRRRALGRGAARATTEHPERDDYSPNLHQIWDTEMVERDMQVASPYRYADELDEKFRAESAAWEAEGIHVVNWAWEVHTRAESEVYEAFSTTIPVEPDAKPKSCSENNHIGKRMLEKHLTADEAYQRRAAKALEMGLAVAAISFKALRPCPIRAARPAKPDENHSG